MFSVHGTEPRVSYCLWLFNIALEAKPTGAGAAEGTHLSSEDSLGFVGSCGPQRLFWNFLGMMFQIRVMLVLRRCRRSGWAMNPTFACVPLAAWLTPWEPMFGHVSTAHHHTEWPTPQVLSLQKLILGSALAYSSQMTNLCLDDNRWCLFSRRRFGFLSQWPVPQLSWASLCCLIRCLHRSTASSKGGRCETEEWKLM